ncbi:hypothetical protein AMTR_s00068p00122110 [Amborella trichopoda]|uniref:Uncharacterized protein n=1 Tax=Amborella trichopoda TaxID=13333 RepID=U5DDZ6_AMBTC|nr:hypothetical protein AMTR_s00068p00122110 [Amborella trichopoda]
MEKFLGIIPRAPSSFARSQRTLQILWKKPPERFKNQVLSLTKARTYRTRLRIEFVRTLRVHPTML